MSKALLVMDTQENLLNPDSKMHIETSSIDPFCNNVNKAIDSFHDKGLPVIYIANEWTNPIANIFTGNVCKKGGKGTGLDKKIHLVNDTVYTKSAANALANPELLEHLKETGITELYITGLFAEACVKETVRSGIRHRFAITIVEDAIGAKSERAKSKSMEYYKHKGAKIVRANQL